MTTRAKISPTRVFPLNLYPWWSHHYPSIFRSAFFSAAKAVELGYIGSQGVNSKTRRKRMQALISATKLGCFPVSKLLLTQKICGRRVRSFSASSGNQSRGGLPRFYSHLLPPSKARLSFSLSLNPSLLSSSRLVWKHFPRKMKRVFPGSVISFSIGFHFPKCIL